MSKTYLMIEEMECEVCAMAVGNGSHSFQAVAKLVCQHLRASSIGTEKQCVINRLCYPGPVEAFVTVQAALIETNYC